MCKAPKPPAVKEPEKPEFMHNPYLDAAIGQSGIVDSLRSGRASLRIRQASTPAAGRQPGEALTNPAAGSFIGNAQPVGTGGPSTVDMGPIGSRRGRSSSPRLTNR